MNLYEILEVSEKASKEIIEKAYKTLAKKYHPDLQAPENKKSAEDKMKLINEAYDILSDDIKRQEYDGKLQLERDEIKRREIQRQINEQQKKNQEKSNTQQASNTIRPNYGAFVNETKNEINNYQKKVKNYIRYASQPSNDTYYTQKPKSEFMNMLSYKLQKIKELVLTILIMVCICAVLWFFPPTHRWIINMYYTNPVIKGIVDVIIGIF